MSLLNGPLEYALRLLLILDSEFPTARNIDELLVLDHVSLHTADFGGPDSLHPALPLRSADVGARREGIRNGLELLVHRGLAIAHLDESGIRFRASETAHAVAQLLESSYATQLRDLVQWVASTQRPGTDEEARDQLAAIIESWPGYAEAGSVS